ncbi:MAG TPA: lysophospholipid acyltransferase family protein [Dermatophilaceae bacterium]|nr:lysophospholipid acyltransferase family protein [Dermatophilaceae bacterium]
MAASTGRRTAAGGGRPSALAAGAQRASGERARRRSTPLLAVPGVEVPGVEVPAVEVPAVPAPARGATATTAPRATTTAPAKAARPKAAPAKAATKAARPKAATTAAPGRAAAAKGAAAKAATAAGPAKAATKAASEADPTKAGTTPDSPDAPSASAPTAPRPAHRPRPTVSSGASKKATAQAGERRRRTHTGAGSTSGARTRGGTGGDRAARGGAGGPAPRTGSGTGASTGASTGSRSPGSALAAQAAPTTSAAATAAATTSAATTATHPTTDTDPTTTNAAAAGSTSATSTSVPGQRTEVPAPARTPAAPMPASEEPAAPRRRPSRAAVRARAVAAGSARPHLRLAEPPTAATVVKAIGTSTAVTSTAVTSTAVTSTAGASTTARSTALARRAPDPTLVPHGNTALPVPGVEELVRAGIAALRLAASGAGLSPEEVERRVAATLVYVRRRIEGEYTVDEFGYDEHFAENVVFPLLRPLYRRWFRVEVRGIENIPAQGGALVVANHSGTVAFDSLMVQLAVHDEHPRHRVMRALGADLVFSMPFVGALARRGGATLATNADAERLFERGEVVGVFPEGFKGIGKPFRERYKLQRFGRGGFVSAALKAGVPIIPTSVVGAEEIAPILGNLGSVARVLGVPYVPVTPTFPWLGPLGLVPLPSKWIIQFGAPIDTASHGSAAADDPMVVFDLTDQVRETIQQTLYSLLMQRRSVFF